MPIGSPIFLFITCLFSSYRWKWVSKLRKGWGIFSGWITLLDHRSNLLIGTLSHNIGRWNVGNRQFVMKKPCTSSHVGLAIQLSGVSSLWRRVVASIYSTDCFNWNTLVWRMVVLEPPGLILTSSETSGEASVFQSWKSETYSILASFTVGWICLFWHHLWLGESVLKVRFLILTGFLPPPQLLFLIFGIQPLYLGGL